MLRLCGDRGIVVRLVTQEFEILRRSNTHIFSWLSGEELRFLLDAGLRGLRRWTSSDEQSLADGFRWRADRPGGLVECQLRLLW